MGAVSTFLWFDDQAKEAAEFYTELVPNSRILSTEVLPDGSPAPGTVTVVTFELDGQLFRAMNAGPRFPFTEAVSIEVSVETQAEVDRLWSALIADGGEESRCGWLRDRWGLSWQIVPTALATVLGGADREGAARALQAMLRMSKIDVAALEAAYAGA
ncbi:VOC family protein [Rathayibacter sp. VKM Ac-2856]|uniref:VOC family protein n=1 Tax=unclassified Rathayibacter TaxID=2609250 RepID=UPI0015679753|nr:MULTISPECIES: VOC family protein [unclassified Rathayibacter]NQX04221.1 VOC family protein [Rathayibacter sp. VKM Ac-2858]NQX19390.1 VOC family protein [Rathayibacter sp. VKM Ac-2856]